VLVIDEAQEMSPDVLGELRILSSADFDATSLLTVILSGDGRLLELLRQEALVPLGTRIRTRLVTEPASREELLELLQHALTRAGNATLMTTVPIETLVDHSAGNYRVLMIMGVSSWPMPWRTRSHSLTKNATSMSTSPGAHARGPRRK
jgi:type II secretory pathway predicted ATPase ExeA